MYVVVCPIQKELDELRWKARLNNDLTIAIPTH